MRAEASYIRSGTSERHGVLDRDNSFNYKGWIIALYNEPAGLLFHECEDAQLGMTAIQIKTVEHKENAFTALCLYCHASMPVEYSQVLIAMWHLARKTC